MRGEALLTAFLLAWANMVNGAFAQTQMRSPTGTQLDVAPTTLDLKPGVAGLVYVSNHSDGPVTVQIEAMDWRQVGNRDLLSPSTELFTSPPIVRIAPGARQSVRVMARPPGTGERVYRLLVSELPDAGLAADGVRVLLQFSLPVFLRRDPGIAPALAWSGRGGRLTVTNTGAQTAKLLGVSVNGAALDGQGLVYVLPGATRDLGPLAQGGQVQAREGRSGALLSALVAP